MTTRRDLEIARRRAMLARFGREMEIWLATCRSDGRPHLVPVWFVWLDDVIYFVTSGYSQKWVNLLSNQQVALSLPDPNNVLVVEGEAHACGRQQTHKLARYFADKYEWDFLNDADQNYRMVQVTPHKILAWGDGYDDLGSRIL